MPHLMMAQKFKFFGGASYGMASYEFQDDGEAFADVKTSGISTLGLQTSVQLVLSESFRIGSGLSFQKISGKSSPVFIDSRFINPNATGDYTLEVNSSTLMIPFEFICILNKTWKVRPLLTAGLPFYIPLKTSYQAKINPTSPSTFYPKMDADIDEVSEMRGGIVGAGFFIPIKDRELLFRLNYKFNSLGYQVVSQVLTEKRALKFSVIEASVGISVF